MTDRVTSEAIKAGDQLLRELSDAPAPSSHAPTMGRLMKVRYTHAAMIDFIIQNPLASQNEIAAYFGFTPSWISNILASDAFQAAMAARREEVIDPTLKASIEERFRALVIKSQEVLMRKLESPNVSDNVAIRAAELGARALGIGGHAPPAPAAPSPDRLTILADRLILLNRQTKGDVHEGQGIRLEAEPETAGG